MKGKLIKSFSNNSKILWITFLLYIFIQTFSHGFYSYYFLNYVKIPLSTYSSAKGLWFVCVLLLQIPSGYLADKYSKKMLLLTSLVSMLVAFVLYELSVQNYNNFYFAEIFSGISTALGTGTIELLLIEKIKKSHIFSKIEFISTFVQLLNVACGILLVNYFHDFIWIIPICITVLVCILIIFFVSDNKQYVNSMDFKVSVVLNSVIKPKLMFYILINALLFTVAQRIFNFWQSYVNLTLSSTAFIYLYSLCIFLFQLIGNSLSRFVNSITYVLIIFSTILLLPLCTNLFHTSFLIVILVIQILRGMISPFFIAKIVENSKSHLKSISLSFASMLRSLLSFAYMSFLVPLLFSKKISLKSNIEHIITSTSLYGLSILFLILICFVFSIRKVNKIK